MQTIAEIEKENLPSSLLKYENMGNLGKLMAEFLCTLSDEIKESVIFPRIDELSEDILDILAYDLHIDWYDYGFDVETKRAVIKSSVAVHKKLGTKYAVETALSAIYSNATVTPWFENGGEPYYFDVDIVLDDYKGLDWDAVEEVMKTYKSVRDRVGNVKFTTENTGIASLGGNVGQAKTEYINNYDVINTGAMVYAYTGIAMYEYWVQSIEAEILVPSSGGDSSSSIGYINFVSGVIDEGVIGDMTEVEE